MSNDRQNNNHEGNGGDRKGNRRRRRGRHRHKADADVHTKPTKKERGQDPDSTQRPHGASHQPRLKSKHGIGSQNNPQGRSPTSGSKHPKSKDRGPKSGASPQARAPQKERVSARLVKELSQPTETALRESRVSGGDFCHVKRRYGLAMYDNFAQAKADLDRLKELEQQFDQLNIVIRAEGNMDDPELNAIGRVKVFAGAAWSLIHDRRLQDGWYEEPQ